ncbi:hypothetical protein KIPB_011821, partial [Kipferlia bialata]|eukprot:g11821.t1
MPEPLVKTGPAEGQPCRGETQPCRAPGGSDSSPEAIGGDVQSPGPCGAGTTPVQRSTSQSGTDQDEAARPGSECLSTHVCPSGVACLDRKCTLEHPETWNPPVCYWFDYPFSDQSSVSVACSVDEWTQSPMALSNDKYTKR